MQPSFNQLIFCTAMLVSAAAKAQEICVINRTNTTYEVTIFSANETEPRTITLNPLYGSLSTIPSGSIRSLRMVDTTDDSRVIECPYEKIKAYAAYHKHYFEIILVAPGESTNTGINGVFMQGLEHIQNISTSSQPYILHSVDQ